MIDDPAIAHAISQRVKGTWSLARPVSSSTD